MKCNSELFESILRRQRKRLRTSRTINRLAEKQREYSRFDRIVERARPSVIRDIISQLRQKTGEDRGDEPDIWIQKYANKK
jgi:hypothetical protein